MVNSKTLAGTSLLATSTYVGGILVSVQGLEWVILLLAIPVFISGMLIAAGSR